MNRRRFLETAFTLSLTGTIITLSGCGGGSKNSSGTNNITGTPWATTALTGRAELPDGIPVTGARIVSLLDDTALNTDGSFQTALIAGGPQFVTVRDAVGNIVLFGFLREGQEAILSLRSTAEGLLYFALGLFAHGPSQQARGLELLKDAQTGAVEDALREAVRRDGARWLKGNHTALTGALRTTAQTLRGVSGGRGMLITPTERISGITVEGDGISTCKATNYFRRRAYLYSTPVSSQAEEGSVTPLRQNLTRVEISPIAGATSLLGTLTDLVAGKTFYTPQSADIATPPTPADAAVTKYRLYAVGVGLQIGELASFPPPVTEGWREVFFKAVVLDYVVPFFANIVLSLKGEQVEEFLAYNDSAAVLKDLINALAATPDLFDKAMAGNFAEACADAVQFVWNTDTWKIALISLLGAFALRFAPASQIRGGFIESAFREIGSVLAVPDFAFSAFDTAVQALDLASSRMGETWEVAVTKPKVTLTPKQSSIASTGTVTLKATLQEASSVTTDIITYRWSVTGGRGHLEDGTGQSNTAFDSTKDTVVYHHEERFGTDSVTVEVFVGGVNNPNRRSLGKNTATIEIDPRKVRVAGRMFPRFLETETTCSQASMLAFPKVPNAVSYEVHINNHRNPVFTRPNAVLYLDARTLQGDWTWTDAGSEIEGGFGGGSTGKTEAGCSANQDHFDAYWAGATVEVIATL